MYFTITGKTESSLKEFVCFSFFADHVVQGICLWIIYAFLSINREMMQKKVEYWKYAAVFSHRDSFERIQRNIGFGRHFVRVSQMADIIKELLIVASFLFVHDWILEVYGMTLVTFFCPIFFWTFCSNNIAVIVLFKKNFG